MRLVARRLAQRAGAAEEGASQRADRSLKALEGGDAAFAEQCLQVAKDLLLSVYRLISGDKMRALGKPLKRAGRRPGTATAEEIAERHIRLAEAYEPERATGKPRRTALTDARDRVPELRDLSYSVLEKALANDRKLSKKL